MCISGRALGQWSCPFRLERSFDGHSKSLFINEAPAKGKRFADGILMPEPVSLSVRARMRYLMLVKSDKYPPDQNSITVPWQKGAFNAPKQMCKKPLNHGDQVHIMIKAIILSTVCPDQHSPVPQRALGATTRTITIAEDRVDACRRGRLRSMYVALFQRESGIHRFS